MVSAHRRKPRPVGLNQGVWDKYNTVFIEFCSATVAITFTLICYLSV